MKKKHALRALPNLLTACRFLAVPIFVMVLIDPTPHSKLWATAIFVIASLTDWLDGYLARLYRAESILGTLLDPLADKILVMAALVMLVAVPTEPRVPAWIVVIILSREILVTGLRSLAAIKAVVVPASPVAKHKTFWTMFAIILLLIHEQYLIAAMQINFHSWGMAFLWLALALSIYSGVEYAIRLRKLFIAEWVGEDISKQI